MRDMNHPLPNSAMPTPATPATPRTTLWGLALAATAWLAGCATPLPPADTPTAPVAPPSTASTPATPPAMGAQARRGAASQAKTPREYRADAAGHLYALNSERVFKGKLPPLLYAIGVLQVHVDGKGQVSGLSWMRAPTHAPEVVAEIERTVRQAAPYPVSATLGRVTYTDTWLWDRSGKFQLDTLTEGQLGELPAKATAQGTAEPQPDRTATAKNRSQATRQTASAADKCKQAKNSKC